MEELLEILNDIQPGVDFENEKHLIDDHLLDSLSIISLVAELEDTFDVTIPAVEIIPDNFNSAEAMLEMLQRLRED
ncbi:MAG: phosphopantetheine-binding protein [Eubacteriales bacterium]|nr:phosphopantetheine-binding protein [Clostridiales bacterium]MDD6372379.1 phosphopantetheine-binding protein [Eubacteriales bacterium]MDD7260797.1 phosphopantetheine-binding protein [Eubacteriales bacterium]MDY6068083.1 phosphopantetheine-binding protein [Candidatus Faecousia sp.]